MRCGSGYAGAALAAAALLAATATSAENWKSLKGSELKLLFAGKELGDDQHYAYRFSADGRFAGVEMGRDVRGTWRVAAQEVCWTWIRPRGVEECYAVQRDGNAVRLLRNGAEAWFGTLKATR